MCVFLLQEAIKHYDSVIVNLEFARELQKNFSSVAADVSCWMAGCSLMFWLHFKDGGGETFGDGEEHIWAFPST